MAHQAIVELGCALGYVNNDERGGVCNGVTLAWISACMINEEEKFLKRIQRIEDDYENGATLHLDIQQVKEKVKRHEHLTEDEEELLEIPAFFEQVALYQKPNGLSMFNDYTFYSQRKQDIAPISKMASSKAMETLGELSPIHSDISIYSIDDLENYLSDIEAEIVANGLRDENKIALLMRSGKHAIGLTYEPILKRWSVMDINVWPRDQYDSVDKQTIAKSIFYSLSSGEDTHMALETTMITTAQSLNNKQEQFQEFDAHLTTSALNKVTNEFCKKKQIERVAFLAATEGDVALIKKLGVNEVNLKAKFDGKSLVVHAALFGQAEVITELVNQGVDLDFPNDEGGRVVAHSAAQNGHVNVIRTLGVLGADLNKVDVQGRTAAYVATICDRGNAIEELALFKADLNIAGIDGVTPVWNAAVLGHINALNALVANGADLNKANIKGVTPVFAASVNDRLKVLNVLMANDADVNIANNDGVTPVYAASVKGHLNVLNALATNGADLNIANNNGTTPVWAAVSLGQLNAVIALAAKGADLNKTDKAGVSPLFVAAQNGLLPEVRFLLQHPTIQKIPFISTRDSLTVFASNIGNDAIERMDEHIKFKLQTGEKEDHITTTPEEIAHIMGHAEVVAVFKSSDILCGAQITEHYKNKVREIKEGDITLNPEEMTSGTPQA
ncbi:MAG: ankyrin repeat domain-containing protein [Legionella sp.]|nr:ankyrin repeat domain-containing protein [Legionella sp.]